MTSAEILLSHPTAVPRVASGPSRTNTKTSPLAGGPGTFGALVDAAAQHAKISPQLLDALVQEESGGNPRAVSTAGAIGYTQLMPGTAAALKVNPWNPGQNLRGGAEYLAAQLHHFHGNLPEALAAYNAGPGAVEAYHGIPPYLETQRYVHAILAHLASV